MSRPAVLGTTLISIFERHHLLSVTQLLDLVAVEGGKSYNKTSMYRALEKLEEQGIICQHVFATGESKYELRRQHHDHLVCTRCGAVASAKLDLEIPARVEGFATDHHHLTIFGLCPVCQTA